MGWPDFDLREILGRFTPGATPPEEEQLVSITDYSLTELEAGPKVNHLFWQLAQPHLYAAWKARFVRPAPAGGVFVVDRNTKMITSEGMAFGLLLAVQNNDFALFNQLLLSLEVEMMQKGLPAWGGYINSKGKFVVGPRDKKPDDTDDYNASASDADIHIGLALVQAYQKAKNGEFGWRAAEEKYEQMATRTLDLIWSSDVFDGGEYTILKPSNASPGPLADRGVPVNPSYFAFAAFELFAAFDNERGERSNRWLDLKADCYEILDIITEQGIMFTKDNVDKEEKLWQKGPVSEFGQVPDWVAVWYKDDTYQINAMAAKDQKTEGEEEKEEDKRTSHQGFDAVRIFWQVALDALWYKDERAIRLARRLIKQLEARHIFDPRKIPVYDKDGKRHINQPHELPRTIVLATYAALAQAAATPLPSKPGMRPSGDEVFGVDRLYTTWANKTANLFFYTFQTLGNDDGPFFVDRGVGPDTYYDQTTAVISSMILGQGFEPIFTGKPKILSRTAEELRGNNTNIVFYRWNFLVNILNSSERAKLTDIIGYYRHLESLSQEEISTAENLEIRFQLARSLAAFGYKEEALEQYKIFMTDAMFDRDYRTMVEAYLELKALILETTSAAGGIRIFREIAAANPSNLFAKLGRAQFKRNLYSSLGFLHTIGLCNQLLKEADEEKAPEIHLEAYRLKAEAHFELFVAGYFASRGNMDIAKEGETEDEKIAFDSLAAARKLEGIEDETLREGIVVAEGEFHSRKADLAKEKEEETKGTISDLRDAQKWYKEALKTYTGLLATNNRLGKDASFRRDKPYRVLAQFILLKTIDLYVKLGETEKKIAEMEGKTGDQAYKSWGLKAEQLLVLAKTGGQVGPGKWDDPSLGREFEAAVELIEGIWTPSVLEQESEVKLAGLKAKWDEELLVKSVHAAKLDSFGALMGAFEKFLSLAPVGRLRFIFEKQKYTLEKMDRARMQKEGAQFVHILKFLLDPKTDFKQIQADYILSLEMNQWIREVLDLIRGGKWEEAKAKLEDLRNKPVGEELNRRLGLMEEWEEEMSLLSTGFAAEAAAWTNTDLDFMLDLQALLAERANISDIEEFLAVSLEKYEMLRGFAYREKPLTKLEREKMEQALSDLEKLQYKVEIWDTRGAGEVVQGAIKTLETKYGELPYDPQWTSDFVEAYFALIWQAKNMGEDKQWLIANLLIDPYTEMIGQTFWQGECRMKEQGEAAVAKLDDKAKEERRVRIERLREMVARIQLVLRDRGISNLMFTTFDQRGYLKVKLLETLGGLLWDPATIRCSNAIYKTAHALDPSNLGISAKLKEQESNIGGSEK